jgi:hypothetical protein
MTMSTRISLYVLQQGFWLFSRAWNYVYSAGRSVFSFPMLIFGMALLHYGFSMEFGWNERVIGVRSGSILWRSSCEHCRCYLSIFAFVIKSLRRISNSFPRSCGSSRHHKSRIHSILESERSFNCGKNSHMRSIPT